MTGGIHVHSGTPGTARARHDLSASLLGEVVPQRARGEPASALPADADLSNVVVLFRQRRPAPEAAPAPLGVSRDERPAPPSAFADRWIPVFLAVSLAAHAGFAAYFIQPPPPLASIGVVSMSVEIVLGADLAAGLAKTPSPSETAVSSVPSPEQSEDTAEHDVARTETKVADEPQVVERQVERQVEREPPPPEPLVPEAVEATEVPAEIPTPTPVEVAELPPPATTPEPKVEQPPEPPKPRPREVETVKPKPPEPELAKPVEKPPQSTRVEQPKREKQRRANERGKRKVASIASSASSGIGRGRSDASTNYRGVVAAHLARHKQYPADSRSRGEQGSATVTFTIDGGGRVTRVSITRQTGIASLDAETVAMVRRASPFPAPPTGQAMSFTVPVSFALR
jgi:periplasmic protein TonB